MLEYIPCYGASVENWGLLPPTRLASRKILIEHISKSGQGQHSVYSVVETAKSVPYRRLMLTAVQLSSEVYSSFEGEGLRCNVLYQRRPLNLQYPHRVKPQEILTSL
jgi:hypothetical protein